MAFNLGRIMRSLIGAGKPRYLAVLTERLRLIHFIMRWFNEISQCLNILSKMIDNAKLTKQCFAA